MDQYILDLAAVAGITARPSESLAAFRRRVAVHEAYAAAQSKDDHGESLSQGDMAYHFARTACCRAIMAA
jgi:hypothetical protein